MAKARGHVPGPVPWRMAAWEHGILVLVISRSRHSGLSESSPRLRGKEAPVAEAPHASTTPSQTMVVKDGQQKRCLRTRMGFHTWNESLSG